jgi:hypothetical protein
VFTARVAPPHSLVIPVSYSPQASRSTDDKLGFPQVSLMVLPPPLGQGLQLAEFRKINRRFFIKDNDERKLKQQFAGFFQVSGIAHWQTPSVYETELKKVLDDRFFGRSGALSCVNVTNAFF